ncbi:MAG: MFS transporter [Candidatus Rokuibacteriota bacterium]
MPASERRVVVAWTLYDFGNSAFAAIIQATVFPVFFASAVVGNAEGRGDFWWGLMGSTAMGLVAVSSPLLGGIADHAGVRKPLLVGFTLVSVAATALLATLEPGMLVRGFILGVTAMVSYEVAFVYYNSYLPRIAPPHRMGRVSAAGFAVGYFGSLVAFLVAYPLLGAQAYWACFITAAAQFLIFALPAFLLLPADTRHGIPFLTAVGRGARETRATLREILTDPERAQLKRFLTAYFVYEDGVNTVIAFSAIFAGKTLGFTLPETIGLFMVVQVTALIGSAAWAKPTDLRGPRFVILITLVQWTLVTVLAYFVTAKWQFWVVAVLAGTGLGAIQAASRAFMARLVPAGREAEFFGFYSLVGKTGAIAGPIVFGMVSWLMGGDQRTAILTVGLFFLVGGLLLRRVTAGGPAERALAEA